MKKLLVIAFGFAVVLSLSTAVLADDEIKVKGTVAKIDEATKSITIKPKDGADITVIMEDADKLARVKEGEKAEVKYMAKDGTNVGLKVRKLTEGCQ